MIQVDLKQVIEEVKERNIFFRSIVDIKDKILYLFDKDKAMPKKYRDNFEQIINKCDEALNREADKSDWSRIT